VDGLRSCVERVSAWADIGRYDAPGAGTMISVTALLPMPLLVPDTWRMITFQTVNLTGRTHGGFSVHPIEPFAQEARRALWRVGIFHVLAGHFEALIAPRHYPQLMPLNPSLEYQVAFTLGSTPCRGIIGSHLIILGRTSHRSIRRSVAHGLHVRETARYAKPQRVCPRRVRETPTGRRSARRSARAVLLESSRGRRE